MNDNKTKALVVVAAIIITFFIGVGVGASGRHANATPRTRTITRTVTKTVTPDSCKQVIDLDNQIFSSVGQALSQWPDASALDTTTQFIQDHTSERTANVLDCEASS